MYDNLESYIKPVLRQNGQKLSLIQGGFTGYRLATDQDGEVFYRQAVKYMKDTLGARGIQMLVEKFQEKQGQVSSAEEAGRQAEEGNTLENYEAEMNEAARNSEAARQAEEAAENAGNEEFTSGFGNGGRPGGSRRGAAGFQCDESDPCSEEDTAYGTSGSGCTGG